MNLDIQYKDKTTILTIEINEEINNEEIFENMNNIINSLNHCCQTQPNLILFNLEKSLRKMEAYQNLFSNKNDFKYTEYLDELKERVSEIFPHSKIDSVELNVFGRIFIRFTYLDEDDLESFYHFSPYDYVVENPQDTQYTIIINSKAQFKFL